MQRDQGAVNSALRLFLRVIRAQLIRNTQVLRQASLDSRSSLQIGAVAFIHRFGSSLNEHVHFHVCVVDGVFETTSDGVQFHEAAPPTGEQIEQVQRALRRRLLRAFVGRGYLDKSDAKAMLRVSFCWRHW